MILRPDHIRATISYDFGMMELPVIYYQRHDINRLNASTTKVMLSTRKKIFLSKMAKTSSTKSEIWSAY